MIRIIAIISIIFLLVACQPKVIDTTTEIPPTIDETPEITDPATEIIDEDLTEDIDLLEEDEIDFDASSFEDW